MGEDFLGGGGLAQDWSDITVFAPKTVLNAAQVQFGPPIEPLSRVLLYDPAEWEKFIDEWVSSHLKPKYQKVLRFTGANDRGIDIAGFADEDLLLGVWDNYQCKHYAASLMPSDAWPEIGKILWHSFSGHYLAPRAYFFVAPKGTGTTLTQYPANAPQLKAKLVEVWQKNVENAITSTGPVKLEGAFASYVDAFDFKIFKTATPREVVEQHRLSPYFIARFGGGLPPRPKLDTLPEEIGVSEKGYVGALLDAYADHKKEPVPDPSALTKWKPLNEHFRRQRECFYHAEALRVFVRDKVEPGTFEGLQDEVYHGIVDTCDGEHADGYACVKAVTELAQSIPLDAHPLGQSAGVKDRRGICHQLANDSRLKWAKS